MRKDSYSIVQQTVYTQNQFMLGGSDSLSTFRITLGFRGRFSGVPLANFLYNEISNIIFIFLIENLYFTASLYAYSALGLFSV
jgi:hypothetical protein